MSHLGLTLVVLLATLALARWSFDRGFNDYRNALEEERLGALAESLRERYRDDGNNWATLTDQHFQALSLNSRPARKHHRNGNEKPARKRRKRIAPTALFDSDDNHIAGDPLADTARADASRVDVRLDGKK